MRRAIFFGLLFLIFLTLSVKADFAPLVFPDDSPLYFFHDFDSMYISSYTFTSYDIASALKGKNVILLVEKNPVGGIPDKELLCSLDVQVYLYDGNRRFLHAKYAVKDNSSFIVTTENFGSFKSRGWGVVVNDENEAQKLVDTFIADLKDSERLNCTGVKRVNIAPFSKPIKKYDFVEGNATVFTDNYLENVLTLLRNSETIWIEQFYFHKKWSDRQNPLIKELLGKKVKVLLDGEWYNLKKNKETAEYLNSMGIDAKVENTPLKFHVKGLILDRKTALVSSINWNENSMINNREVGVVLRGDIKKFVDSFEKDWSDASNRGRRHFQMLREIVTFLIVVSLAALIATRKYQVVFEFFRQHHK